MAPEDNPADDVQPTREEWEEYEREREQPAVVPQIRVVNVRGFRAPEQRATVVYCGRPFAGWAGHPLGNPFKPNPRYLDTDDGTELQTERDRAVKSCLEKYRDWLLARPTLDADLAALWEQTKGGELPLGCWCVSATAGDGQPLACHAQILAEMLRERYASPTSETPGNV